MLIKLKKKLKHRSETKLGDLKGCKFWLTGTQRDKKKPFSFVYGGPEDQNTFRKPSRLSWPVSSRCKSPLYCIACRSQSSDLLLKLSDRRRPSSINYLINQLIVSALHHCERPSVQFILDCKLRINSYNT